jgi:Iron-containing redox enzyme
MIAPSALNAARPDFFGTGRRLRSVPVSHAELNAYYLRQLSPPAAFGGVPGDDESLSFREAERLWNLQEEARLDLTELPTHAEGFAVWYAQLHRLHRTRVAPFFEHLAQSATVQELALYIGMEEQVDGRFDDVIALAQLGMTGDMKLALAENFWDEMGLGHLEGMHTRMFMHSAAHMRDHLRGLDMASMVPVEALKNGNLLLMYALNRRFTPRLLGALAILEHTAPYRFSHTVRGLRRLGIPEDVVRYHQLHIEVDANHGRQLLERVLKPLVAESAPALREVCIGCLIRYQVALDYYAALGRVMDGLRNHPALQPQALEGAPA